MLKQLDYFPKIGLALVLSAVLALIATPFVMKLAKKVGAMDIPKDERRMHHVPIPRMGGLAIIFGFTVSVLLFVNLDTQTCGILAGAAVIAALGIANRLRLASGTEPERVERQLRAVLPPEESSNFCHRIVLFGRDTCTARKPRCEGCPLRAYCTAV